MLLYDDKYTATLRDLFRNAREVSMAIAFWGEGGNLIFDDCKKTPVRIICNLALGGTNPKVIQELKKRKNTEVRQLDNLHAKLVLTDNHMIVGSANISSNGLGLEAGEAARFRELGLLSQDAKQLKSARDWFKDLWQASQEITESHLRNAQKTWESRRNARPWAAGSGSRNLIDMPASELRKRKIYFAIFRAWLSEQAAARLEEENKKLANSSHPEHGKTLDAYEGWDEKLPKDPDAVVIPIYWGKRGGIKIYPAQRPFPELRDDRTSLDFTIKVKDTNTLGLPFSLPPGDDKGWQEEIRNWLEAIKNKGTNAERACKPVYEFLKWREEQLPG